MAEIFMELIIFQTTFHSRVLSNWLGLASISISGSGKKYMLKTDSNDEKSPIGVFVVLSVILEVSA